MRMRNSKQNTRYLKRDEKDLASSPYTGIVDEKRNYIFVCGPMDSIFWLGFPYISPSQEGRNSYDTQRNFMYVDRSMYMLYLMTVKSGYKVISTRAVVSKG